LKESLAEIGIPEGWERGGWRIDIGEYFTTTELLHLLQLDWIMY